MVDEFKKKKKKKDAAASKKKKKKKKKEAREFRDRHGFPAASLGLSSLFSSKVDGTIGITGMTFP